jgi:hypothetical protein
MAEAELILADVELQQSIDKLEAVRKLGSVVTHLRLQIDSIQESMDTLAPTEAIEAPEGMAFRFMAIGPEDPMHVEVQRSEYHNETVWARVWPHDYERLGGPKTKTPNGRWYFDGARIEYGHDRRIWIYSKEPGLRVLFEDGIRFDGIVIEQE